MSRARPAGAAALGVLIVVAAVAPFTTGAVAQSNVYTKTVDTSDAKYVTIDGSGVSGEMQIEVYIPKAELPNADASRFNGDQVLLRRVIVGDGYAIQNFAYRNERAYSEYEIRVELLDGASGEPTISTGAGDLTVEPIGGTGGDADLSCDLVESLTSGPNNPIVDCAGTPPEGYNTTTLDANESKASITAHAGSVEARRTAFYGSGESITPSLENDALIVGKIAYVRALEDGASEPVATERARKAVRNFWADRERKVLQQWNQSVSEAAYFASVAENTSGIDDSYAAVYANDTDNYTSKQIAIINATDPNSEDRAFVYMGSPNTDKESYKLVNGNTTGVKSFNFTYESGTSTTFGQMIRIGPTADWGKRTTDGPNDWFQFNASEYERFPYTFRVKNYLDSDKSEVFDTRDTRAELNRIESAKQSTVSEVETFVNGTYDDWAAGDVNATDLLSSYEERRLGPEDGYQTWALSELGRLGLATPSTLENTGSMTVTTLDSNGSDVTTYEGILLSDGLPSGDTFEVGTVYNTSNITGPQFVITDTNTVQIDEGTEFRIDSATTKDGTEQSSISYKNITYETQNLSEFQDLLEQQATLLAEIEARQETARGGGGVGGTTGDGFLMGLSGRQLAMIGLAFGGGLLVVSALARN